MDTLHRIFIVLLLLLFKLLHMSVTKCSSDVPYPKTPCPFFLQTRITARLRDQLGTAKNANEMFRIFSRFNALFVRPHIRGAIREYQTQLIQRVKDDIESLHEKFKVNFAFLIFLHYVSFYFHKELFLNYSLLVCIYGALLNKTAVS